MNPTPEQRAEHIAGALRRMAEDSLIDGIEKQLYACQGPPLCFRIATPEEQERCRLCEHFVSDANGWVTMLGVGHA